LLPKNLADEREVSFWMPGMDDPRLRMSRHIVWNLSRPEKSLMLLAPLADEAGGLARCRDPKNGAPVTVFASTGDSDYQKILALASRGKEFLETDKRFDMPGFRPKPEWVREMKRYEIVPSCTTPEDISDPYFVEQSYWQSLWYKPMAQKTARETE
jgi:hypothetical protein